MAVERFFLVSEGNKLRPQEIIQEAASLPVEERAEVADSILRTLNAPETDVDSKWRDLARKRLHELREGDVKSVPGDEVFEKIWKRFER